LSLNEPMKIFLIFFSLLTSLQAVASVMVISDLDDTIKITEAGEAEDILGDKVYSGMPEFLKEIKAYAPKLFILSASPSILRKKIESTLKKKGIRHVGLILRRNIFEDKFNYKVRKIKKILDSSTDEVILIGDDLGKDPEVFQEIKRLYSTRILGSYIHVVKKRTIPVGSIKYWTSFDLALREFSYYRMTANSVERIFRLLALESNLELIFPRKADCPTLASTWEWQAQTIFMQDAIRLSERLTRFCQARQSDNIVF
jgi:hypothetical protein